MPLIGNAFMIIWHDIQPPAQAEYEAWHTREHMPERLAVPGFLRGRRGVAPGAATHRYLTLYEAAGLETFASRAYLERLDNPTPGSVALQPSYFNFIRSACAIVASTGVGVGGAMATVRLSWGAKDARALASDAPKLVDTFYKLTGVSSVHLGIAQSQYSSAKTKETALRGTTADGVFDAVVMIDGVSRKDLGFALPTVLASLAGMGWTVAPNDAVVYDMAFELNALRV